MEEAETSFEMNVLSRGEVRVHSVRGLSTLRSFRLSRGSCNVETEFDLVSIRVVRDTKTEPLRELVWEPERPPTEVRQRNKTTPHPSCVSWVRVRKIPRGRV